MNAVIKSIERLPGYEFTSAGEIISYSRKKPFVMKGMACGEYRAVSFKNKDGVFEKLYMHRAIAEAFHGPCPEGLQCRHLNGNRNDNRPDNLAWGDSAENARDKIGHGTAPIGERHASAKLTNSSVREMRNVRRATGKPYAKIAEDFGISTMTAHRAITGKAWRHI